MEASSFPSSTALPSIAVYLHICSFYGKLHQVEDLLTKLNSKGAAFFQHTIASFSEIRKGRVKGDIIHFDVHNIPGQHAFFNGYLLLAQP